MFIGDDLMKMMVKMKLVFIGYDNNNDDNNYSNSIDNIIIIILVA